MIRILLIIGFVAFFAGGILLVQERRQKTAEDALTESRRAALLEQGWNTDSYKGAWVIGRDGSSQTFSSHAWADIAPGVRARRIGERSAVVSVNGKDFLLGPEAEPKESGIVITKKQ